MMCLLSHVLAMECLDAVSASTSENASQLFGCVLEAQSTGDKRLAVAALQRVLEKYEHRAPAGVNVPCLLRSVPESSSCKCVEYCLYVLRLLELQHGSSLQRSSQAKWRTKTPLSLSARYLKEAGILITTDLLRSVSNILNSRCSSKKLEDGPDCTINTNFHNQGIRLVLPE
jgi:hypothetical protein